MAGLGKWSSDGDGSTLSQLSTAGQLALLREESCKLQT